MAGALPALRIVLTAGADKASSRRSLSSRRSSPRLAAAGTTTDVGVWVVEAGALPARELHEADRLEAHAGCASCLFWQVRVERVEHRTRRFALLLVVWVMEVRSPSRIASTPCDSGVAVLSAVSAPRMTLVGPARHLSRHTVSRQRFCASAIT